MSKYDMPRQILFFGRAIYSLFFDRQDIYDKADTKHFVYKNISSSFYERKGEGEYTILIIPGFGQSLISWKGIVKTLSKDSHIVIFELPYRGKRKKETALWSEKEFADFAIYFMKKHIKKDVILIGHSLGGKVAALISISLQKRIRFLVLYAVGGIHIRLPLKKRIIDNLKHFLYRKNPSLDFSNIYSKIFVPTLLLYGENDLITPVEVGMKISEIVPNRIFMIIPHVTHLAHRELPDVFIKKIKEAIERFHIPYAVAL